MHYHAGNPSANADDLLSNANHILFGTRQDFEEAIKKVQPSAKREGFATVPDVSWSDIGKCLFTDAYT